MLDIFSKLKIHESCNKGGSMGDKGRVVSVWLIKLYLHYIQGSEGIEPNILDLNIS
jgi:hypothetical protein